MGQNYTLQIYVCFIFLHRQALVQNYRAIHIAQKNLFLDLDFFNAKIQYLFFNQVILQELMPPQLNAK